MDRMEALQRDLNQTLSALDERYRHERKRWRSMCFLARDVVVCYVVYALLHNAHPLLYSAAMGTAMVSLVATKELRNFAPTT